MVDLVGIDVHISNITIMKIVRIDFYNKWALGGGHQHYRSSIFLGSAQF